MKLEPYFREAGAGPGVVCLHANASSSGQWRGLMELLAPRFRVFAVDSYDSGKSPSWPSDRVIALRDEADLVEPVLEKAGSPLVLVGHSYGGAAALIAALPRVEVVEFAELGHRGPVTQPGRVNEAIAAFLEERYRY